MDGILRHNHAGARPRCHISQQQCDITRPHFSSIDAPLGPHPSFNAARNLKGVVTHGKGQVFWIGDMQPQCDLSNVTARFILIAGKDGFIHVVATQGFGRALAHDEAQSIKQIGLATAVGPDDRGETLRQWNVNRVGKCLKTADADFKKTNRISHRLLAAVLLWHF